MFCQETLSKNASVHASLFSSLTETDEGAVQEYGIAVVLMFDKEEISRCTVPSVSPDRDFVASLADKIVSQRISPAYAADFIERELSK